MNKAILFDLDGTLLPMDTGTFVKEYISGLALAVKDIINPLTFSTALITATKAMVANKDHTKTNERVFTETFLELIEMQKEHIWPTLERFYEKHFDRLKQHAQPTPLARKIVQEATSQGYAVALATNPVFPKAATMRRINWAGLKQEWFDLVTVYENSYFTKPHAEYYENICQRMNVKPENCLMVGNDVQEDLYTGQLGMKTFLVDDYKVDRGEPVYFPDEKGSLKDIYDRLKNRKGIFKDESV